VGGIRKRRSGKMNGGSIVEDSTERNKTKGRGEKRAMFMITRREGTKRGGKKGLLNRKNKKGQDKLLGRGAI